MHVTRNVSNGLSIPSISIYYLSSFVNNIYCELTVVHIAFRYLQVLCSYSRMALLIGSLEWVVDIKTWRFKAGALSLLKLCSHDKRNFYIMCNECKIDYSLSVITTLDSDKIKILFYTYANQVCIFCTLYFILSCIANQKTDKQVKVMGSPKTAPRVHEFSHTYLHDCHTRLVPRWSLTIENSVWMHHSIKLLLLIDDPAFLTFSHVPR